ncbi:putative transcriptional regulator [Azospira oryzae PS]|uniref:Putative transcriptional regulator n=1 Tax=Azospira oryzae (strain ATCC BAA-33 / DSM 13638 / PS) TaxID=640081 RepID=G8QM88_AZOOP|nr:helix-turn-helix transcriptional regulator [Azospira oryzae]AEV24604.1 putative transcriptional regulator [Azospira oryzae PS]
MNSPLKQVRLKRNKTLQEVADAIGTDTGNLSRIERGQQVPSKAMAEKLAKYFDNEVTETQIIYPERFADGANVADGQ